MDKKANGLLSVGFMLSAMLPNLITQPAYAFSVSAGNYTPTTSVQNKAGKTSIFHFNPFLSIGHDFWLSRTLSFSPLFGYSKLFGTNDNYGEASKSAFLLLYDFGLTLGKHFGLRGGPGVYIMKISGPGGTVTIPSGQAQGTAKRPGESSTSYTTTFNLGLDIFLRDKSEGTGFGFRAELIGYALFNNDKRTIGHLLTVVYQL